MSVHPETPRDGAEIVVGTWEYEHVDGRYRLLFDLDDKFSRGLFRGRLLLDSVQAPTLTDVEIRRESKSRKPAPISDSVHPETR